MNLKFKTVELIELLVRDMLAFAIENMCTMSIPGGFRDKTFSK